MRSGVTESTGSRKTPTRLLGENRPIWPRVYPGRLVHSTRRPRPSMLRVLEQPETIKQTVGIAN